MMQNLHYHDPESSYTLCYRIIDGGVPVTFTENKVEWWLSPHRCPLCLVELEQDGSDIVFVTDEEIDQEKWRRWVEASKRGD